MNEQHHHYIPVFYLNQWANAKKRLIEFSRQGPKQIVTPRPTSPRGTGYVPGLYAIEDDDPLVVNAVEDLLMKPSDNVASDALQCLLADKAFPRSQLRTAWARFLLSLMIRYPEAVADIKGRLRENVERLYRENRESDEPEDFAEYERQHGTRDMARGHGSLLSDLMKDSRMGKLVFRMHWRVMSCKNYTHNLLTSDRPLVSNAFALSSHSLCLPIGPAHLFVACGTERAQAEFMRFNPAAVMLTMNNAVAQQAKKYVWSTDHTQLLFVKRRLGKQSGPVGAYLV